MRIAHSLKVLSSDASGAPTAIALIAHVCLDGLPMRFSGTLCMHPGGGGGRALLIALPLQ